jgi:hypothetical protein
MRLIRLFESFLHQETEKPVNLHRSNQSFSRSLIIFFIVSSRLFLYSSIIECAFLFYFLNVGLDIINEFIEIAAVVLVDVLSDSVKLPATLSVQVLQLYSPEFVREN